MTVKEVLAQLESLGDEGRRKYNAKAGHDGIPGIPPENQYGVKTGDLRKLAKKLKTDHDLALRLWKATPPNIDVQMLAILMMDPRRLSATDLDTMVREARFAWAAEWLQSYIIKEQPDAEKEALRKKWMRKSEKDGWAARAGWHLTASMVNQSGNSADAPVAGGLDLEGLLDRIEKEMPKAPPEVQWTMNNTLGAIGIHHAGHRGRAVAIAEKIGLYKDWPVSRGCTPPYVPAWIEATVKGKA